MASDTGLDWLMAQAEGKPAPSVKEKLQDGFYQVGDSIYKVVTSPRSGYQYAKLLVLDGENGNGRWEYVPGEVKRIDPKDTLTPEQAAKFGKLYGVCCICGLILTNEESIERGIGPICFDKMGW